MTTLQLLSDLIPAREVDYGDDFRSQVVTDKDRAELKSFLIEFETAEGAIIKAPALDVLDLLESRGYELVKGSLYSHAAFCYYRDESVLNYRSKDKNLYSFNSYKISADDLGSYLFEDCIDALILAFREALDRGEVLASEFEEAPRLSKSAEIHQDFINQAMAYFRFEDK